MARRFRPRRTRATATALAGILLVGVLQASALAGGTGTLTVSIEPSVDAEVRVDGQARNSRAIAGLELPTGARLVCFGAVEGYVTPPCQTVSVVAGQTTPVVGHYLPAGTLEVRTSPRGAGQVTVDGIARDGDDLRIPVATGAREVCFADLPGYVTPSCQRVQIVAGASHTVVGSYRASGPAPKPKPSAPPTSGQARTRVAAGTDATFQNACPAGGALQPGFRDVPRGGTHGQAIACAVAWNVIAGRSSTAFDPTSAVTRGQVATMLHRLIVATGGELDGPPTRFADLAGSPHRTAVEALAGAGIVAGKGDGSFGGDAPVRRDQMASLLVRALDRGYAVRPARGANFSDVPASGAHAENVRRLVGAGITQGYADGTFAPERAVSREQMATFVMRLADLLVREAQVTPPPSAR